MKTHFLVRCLLIGLFSVVGMAGFLPVSPIPANAQADPVSELMALMSARDKVGQLFIVTFKGSDVAADSDIARLIQEYRVGGVAILASQQNFTNDPGAPAQISSLTAQLQRLASESNTIQSSRSRYFIPLFIATQCVGDSHPYATNISGLTPLPSQMALGATWQPDNAFVVGEIAGRELSALGINMVFGPSLDVQNTPRLELRGGVGTYSFGGDPFWAGQFGRSYIKGIHVGSKGRIATVAQHFPGLGAADRRPEEEVPTVPKSLSELRNLELMPFMAVTSGDDPIATADALMSSHIRYRGFRGNIRQITRPISLDPQNLGMLMSEPEFARWRQGGGLMVTAPLGVPAIRKYYDPQLQTFPARRIAQDAFLAGNDLLYLYQYGLTDDNWTEQFENIKSVLEFFREKYTSDPDFQIKVDESVRRILRAKYKLYGGFNYPEVDQDISRFENDRQVREASAVEIARIAREAITLIYPEIGELTDRTPNPPTPQDNILIFTDSRDYRECEGCTVKPVIEPMALENVIVRLYGPNGSGQISPERVHSVTFAQLKGSLLSLTDSQSGSTADINSLISQANWILFGMLDVNAPNSPASDAIKLFLKLRSDILRDKKIVVMAFDMPYYLDTTEISKLTGYYGVYSKIGAFLEAAVRAVFQEYRPMGNLPVSVESVGYDLITQTAPDPEQVIALNVSGRVESSSADSIGIDIGNELRIRTGVILDRNGHIVPDGTPVNFRLIYPLEMIELPRREVTTRNGIAETAIVLDHAGQLEITASSDPATKSTKLVVTVYDAKAAQTTDGPAAGSQLTTTLNGASAGSDLSLHKTRPRVTPLVFWVTLGGMVLLNILGDVLRLRGGRTRTYRFRLNLIGLLAGLCGYTIYTLGILGTWELWYIYHQWGAVLFGLSFSITPLMIVLVAQGIRASRHGHP